MGEKIQARIQYLNSFYEEKIDGNRRLRLFIFALCFLAIALMLFRLNRPTPWVVDDLLKIQTARTIHSVGQLYDKIASFYLHWGGRIWGEMYAQLFLMLPKHVFDYLNTVGYMILLLLLQWNIFGKWKMSPSILLFLNFSLMLCLPNFGQDILWISGAANYMWASLIPLLFLGFWRVYQVQHKECLNHPLVMCGLFLLGILAGWANENVSVALLGIAFGYMLIYRQQLDKIPRFAYAGSLGLLIGSLALWLAPGNFVRFASERHSRSIFHMLHMVIKNLLALVNPSATLFLVIAFVLLFIGLRNCKKATALNFFIGAVLSSVAFSVIGAIGNRVYFGTTALLLIAVGILYVQWSETVTMRKMRCVLTVFLFLGSVGFYTQGRDGIKDYAVRWNNNIHIIQSEKQKGDQDIFVNLMPPKNKFCATYGLDDIKPKRENQHWLNKGIAKYFDINTIQSIEVEN